MMCTLEKRGGLYILTLTGDGKHKLNPTLIYHIRDAVRRVRSETPLPSALITTARGDFFSGGIDDADPRTHHMATDLRHAVADLLSLPVPTIAAVTGHASAAVLILALAHDHLLMRRDCEVDLIGPAAMPRWFIALLRCKVGSPAALVDVVLRAEKVTSEAALRWGMIRSAHDGAEETLAAAVALGGELAGRGLDGHVYGQHREFLFCEALDAIKAADSFDQTQKTVEMLEEDVRQLMELKKMREEFLKSSR